MNSPVRHCTPDRFIPLRRSSSDTFLASGCYQSPLHISCKEYYVNSLKNECGMSYMQQRYRKNQHSNILMETMFEAPSRVLYFSPPQKKRRKDSKNALIQMDDSWPVKARIKPLIQSPDMILDMPEIFTDSAGSFQRVDWGNTGCIAAIHGDLIHIHNPDTNVRTFIPDAHLGNCVKWSKNATNLAFSSENNSIRIWDVNGEKFVGISDSPHLPHQIRCLVYTRKLIITGDAMGYINAFTFDFHCINSVAVHRGDVLNMKVSCHESYLASSGKDGFIRVRTLPDFQELVQINCGNKPIFSLDWHPWKQSLLAIGKSSNESFCTIFNLNKPKDVQLKVASNNPIVDCLTFNPISAELVVSFWVPQTDVTKFIQNIVVQSSLNRIVDDLNLHTTRTPYLLWDKEGNRLATIGADENLAIWKFFGAESKKKIRDSPIRESILLRSGVIR